ncbi:M28 family metallopeptidase [Paenibacillus sp. D51F]
MFLMVVMSVSSLAACESSQGNSLERIVQLLTDDRMEGRLAGTAGNEQAVQAIEREFARIGLDRVEESGYAVPYPYQSVERKEISLKVNMKDGSVKQLVYGKHFMERVIRMNLDATAELRLDSASLTNQIAFAAGSEEDYELAKSKNPRFIMLRTKEFKKYPLKRTRDIPVVQLNEDTYDFLKRKQADIESISLHMSYEDKETEISNVIGRIPGTSAGGPDHHAIVISAHIDSMGELDGSIYEGASRASGVSSLVMLAESLKQASAAKPFYSDLVFCVFNGRENGLQGSGAYANMMNTRTVHVSDMNLDTVGLKGGEVLLLSEDTGKSMASGLAEHLRSKGIDAQTKLSSDGSHASFAARGVPAVSLGAADDSILRTVRDKESGIDYGRLSKLTDALLSYVMDRDQEALQKHDHMEPENGVPFREMSEFEYVDLKQRMIWGEEAKLSFKQYKYYVDEEQGIRTLVAGTYRSLSTEELNIMYPGNSVPSAMSDYDLVNIGVRVDKKSFLSGNVEELTPNEIYTAERDFEKKDIRSLSLIYQKKDESVLLLEVLNGDELQQVVDQYGKGRALARKVEENGKEFTIYENGGVPFAVSYPFQSGGVPYLVEMRSFVPKQSVLSPEWAYSDAETSALLDRIAWEQLK